MRVPALRIRRRGRDDPHGHPEPSPERGRHSRVSPLWGAYAALALVLVGMGAASLLLDEHVFVERFGANLATEALSVLVTLAFVQRLLEREERARKLRAAVGALRKGRVALAEMLEVWTVLIKGALDPRRTEYPRTVYQLFASYYTEEIACLDPTHRPSGSPDWLNEAVRRLGAATPRLREIILTYGETLDAEYLEALDELVDDPFVAMLRELASGEPLSPDEWRLRINRSRGHLEAHFVRLGHAVHLHNQLASEAARFRSKHLAPSAQALNVRLGADRDLALPTEFPRGWWTDDPPVGHLRYQRNRTAASLA